MSETLFEEFVEQIETAVYAVATQVPYTRQQIVSGELRDLLRWRQEVASKEHGRQDVGSLQDVFRKRVQRDQGPTK